MTDSRTTGDNEIFEGFLTLLKSNETTKVPRETTLGAISHFISTLPLDEVQVLLKAISESPRLWTSLKDRTASREAVQLGVSGAIGRLASQPGSSRWWHRKSSESAWLDEIAKTILEGEGMGKIQIMVAVLAVTSPDVQGKKPMWIGVQRAEMEDEVVMELARMMESTSCEKLDTEVLCVALDVIDGSKIRILDTKAIYVRLTQTLLRTLTASEDKDEVSSSESMSTSIARLFAILDGGEEDIRQFAWIKMRRFCMSMRSNSSHLPDLPRNYTTETESKLSINPVFKDQKTALFALLPPLSSILDIISHDEPPSSSEQSTSPISRTSIALESLYTLSTFAQILAPLEGGMDTYHRVLHGMTDILVSTGGPTGVRNLLKKAPTHLSATPAEGAWWLIFGESVLHYVDQWGFHTVLDPMTDRFIQDDSNASSFEAAHSLRLSIIRAAATDLHRKADISARSLERKQRELIGYCDLLVEQYTATRLTTDQFRSAYPLVVESASKYSDDLVERSLNQLRSAKAPMTEPKVFGQTRLLIIIASAAHIPCHRLRGYLDNIGQDILLTSVNSVERRELNDAIYRMIMHDLGESGRLIGMEWWSQWRRALQVGRIGSEYGMAKL